jgi:hypothetical protein
MELELVTSLCEVRGQKFTLIILCMLSGHLHTKILPVGWPENRKFASRVQCHYSLNRGTTDKKIGTVGNLTDSRQNYGHNLLISDLLVAP